MAGFGLAYKNIKPLNQNQFDALVSLSYNIGTSAFSGSTLVKKLNANDYHGAADQFDVWVNAGGKRMICPRFNGQLSG